jgi:hypothetical protein
MVASAGFGILDLKNILFLLGIELLLLDCLASIMVVIY